jgi:hypothetical protein
MLFCREQKHGADGVKIAVLRKGRASLGLVRAAAHRKRAVTQKFKISDMKKKNFKRLLNL